MKVMATFKNKVPSCLTKSTLHGTLIRVKMNEIFDTTETTSTSAGPSFNAIRGGFKILPRFTHFNGNYQLSEKLFVPMVKEKKKKHEMTNSKIVLVVEAN